MAAERDKNRLQKDLDGKEEEMEELKYHLNRKVGFLVPKPNQYINLVSSFYQSMNNPVSLLV